MKSGLALLSEDESVVCRSVCAGEEQAEARKQAGYPPTRRRRKPGGGASSGAEAPAEDGSRSAASRGRHLPPVAAKRRCRRRVRRGPRFELGSNTHVQAQVGGGRETTQTRQYCKDEERAPRVGLRHLLMPHVRECSRGGPACRSRP